MRKIQRLIICLIVLLFLTISPTKILGNDHYAEIYKAADYVVHLEVGTPSEFTYPNGFVDKKMSWSKLTGFVIDYDNKKWILTAGHISMEDESLEEILVIAYFKNKRRPTEVKIFSYDHLLDVALLEFPDQEKIKDLPTANLGSSKDLVVGEATISISSSHPLKWFLLPGRIGQILPSINSSLLYTQPVLIFHNGNINGGASGSPLIDLKGAVIGVNVILTMTRAFPSNVPHSYGGAVPIDDVKTILPKLIKGGEISHPPLQLMFDDSSQYHQTDLEDLGIDKEPTDGVMITHVRPESLAEKAGFKPGEIVLACDNKPIETVAQLYRLILLEREISDTVQVKINRYDLELVLPLILKAFPDGD